MKKDWTKKCCSDKGDDGTAHKRTETNENDCTCPCHGNNDRARDKFWKAPWTSKCTCENFQQNEDCEHIGNKVLEEVGLSVDIGIKDGCGQPVLMEEIIKTEQVFTQGDCFELLPKIYKENFDLNCADHKCSGELCIVCGYREKIEKEYSHPDCEHNCTSNCRREGCNCLCGEYHGKLDFSEYNEIIKERNCEYWCGLEKCTDKKVSGSIFCRFHSDNLPF